MMKLTDELNSLNHHDALDYLDALAAAERDANRDAHLASLIRRQRADAA